MNRFLLEDAISKGYFIWRKNELALREYYFYCIHNNIPLIRIRPQTRYATVEVDCLDMFVKLSEEAADEIHKVFLAYTKSKTWGRSYGGNISYVYMRKIPLELAEEAAQKIVNLLNKPGYVLVHQAKNSNQ